MKMAICFAKPRFAQVVTDDITELDHASLPSHGPSQAKGKMKPQCEKLIMVSFLESETEVKGECFPFLLL